MFGSKIKILPIMKVYLQLVAQNIKVILINIAKKKWLVR